MNITYALCMYVCPRVCLDFKYGPRNRGSFVRSQSIQKEDKRTLRTQIKCDVENLKSRRNPFIRMESHVFASEEYGYKWRLKNSSELKQYVSQDISSNSWNSTVNKVGVFAKLY